MEPFLASEVVVTSKGRIYHLDLAPGELAPTILLVGDPDRVARVSRRFDRIELTRQHREFVTHTGHVGKRPISVVSTGIGTDNIDIVLNEADMLFNLDLASRTLRSDLRTLTFLRLGTSGGVQEDIQVDEVVFSQAAIGLDGLLNFYAHQPGHLERAILDDFRLALPQVFDVCRPYCALADDEVAVCLAGGFRRGITITSPSFYAGQGRRQRIPSALGPFPDLLPPLRLQGHAITNFEMETAGIYGLARLLGHRAGSFNVILANRPRGTFSSDPQGSVETLLDQVFEHLAQLP
jgi:uridine phosphorylase